MKMNYLAPITEIVYISAQNILEKGQDSTGTQNPWDGPESPDANSTTFDMEEANSNRSIWDD